MKVLQLTVSSKGGAGIAAMRLHEALHERGISSAYVSRNMTIDFNGNSMQDPFFSYRKPGFVKKLYLKIKSNIFPDKEHKIRQLIEEKKALMDYEMLSLPFSTCQLEKHPLVQEADLLNFHWMGGLLDYEAFFKNCKKPIVWTLHDMNPFLGMYHYKNDMLLNAEILGELDKSIKKSKRAIMEKSSIATFISPSQWLLDEAFQNDFLPNVSKEVIANAIDFSLFNNLNANIIREEYSINSDEFVILFVSDSIKNKRKGFDLLRQALGLLEHLPVILVTIGKGESSEYKFKNINLGEINDPKKMASSFTMADVFLLPSREDNLPNVMLESFSAGTPVISFLNGGMKEHITNGETGFLATEITAEALAKAIENVYNNREKYSREKIKKYAYEHFSYKLQAEAYEKMYKKSINQLTEMTTG
ncbi:MAG: glycosyltransferase [Flavobacterium sp.]